MSEVEPQHPDVRSRTEAGGSDLASWEDIGAEGSAAVAVDVVARQNPFVIPWKDVQWRLRISIWVIFGVPNPPTRRHHQTEYKPIGARTSYPPPPQ